MRFLYYYLRSMRLYYAFVTGTTVLAGMLAARCIRPVPWSLRDGVILAIGFLAWGVNQIFNDFGNRREDALNAPHRPMVDGRLAPLPALGLSSLLTVFFVFAAYRVEPVTLIPLGIGIVLNLLYNAGKRVPLLGCAVYGLSISMCLCSIVALIPFVRGKALLKFTKPSFNKAMLKEIAACGSPVFLSNVSGRVTSILMNISLMSLGVKAFGYGGGKVLHRNILHDAAGNVSFERFLFCPHGYHQIYRHVQVRQNGQEHPQAHRR